MKRALAMALAASFSTGCYSTYGWAWHGRWLHHHHRVLVLSGQAVGLTSDAEESAEEADREAIEGAEAAPMYTPPAAYLPPLEPRPDTPRIAFNATAAVAALHAVDVSPCGQRGAPRGYGHARVTFDATGRAAAVTIDAPPGMSEQAVACLGEKLGAATAPPFDGADVTAGASFLVQ